MTSAHRPDGSSETIERALVDAATSALRGSDRRPVVLGLCGAQGSGKSTRTAAVIERLGTSGVSAVGLSLDDLYLPRARRLELTRIHPLLRTRGVPGTHDARLGIALLQQLGARAPVALPAFDKAIDDRAPADQWNVVSAPVEVVVFVQCDEGQRAHVDVELTQDGVSGKAGKTFECTDRLESIPLRIKAKGHYGFEPGPVHADLVAEIRDLGAVVEVLEWSRTVNIVAESEEAEDAE